MTAKQWGRVGVCSGAVWCEGQGRKWELQAGLGRKRPDEWNRDRMFWPCSGWLRLHLHAVLYELSEGREQDLKSFKRRIRWIWLPDSDFPLQRCPRRKPLVYTSHRGSAPEAVPWEPKFLCSQLNFAAVVPCDPQWVMSLGLLWLCVTEKLFRDEKSGVKSAPKGDL